MEPPPRVDPPANDQPSAPRIWFRSATTPLRMPVNPPPPPPVGGSSSPATAQAAPRPNPTSAQADPLTIRPFLRFARWPRAVYFRAVDSFRRSAVTRSQPVASLEADRKEGDALGTPHPPFPRWTERITKPARRSQRRRSADPKTARLDRRLRRRARSRSHGGRASRCAPPLEDEQPQLPSLALREG